jgi:TonB family protein
MRPSGLQPCYQRNLALGLLGAVLLHLVVFAGICLRPILLPLRPQEETIIGIHSLVKLMIPPPPPPIVELVQGGRWASEPTPVKEARDVVDLKFAYNGREYGIVYDPNAGAAAGSDSAGYVEVHSPSHPKIALLEADRLPECISIVLPAYPDSARIYGIEGEVWLQILVSERGEVQDVFVFRKSSVEAGFEEAVVRAAWKWKFRCALADDNPEAVYIGYCVRFSLNRTHTS